jgi:hypothetical protein
VCVAHTREVHRLRVCESRVLRRIFGPKRDRVTEEWRKLHNYKNTIQTLVKTDTDCIVTCSVEDSCLLPLVIIPCRATGCCGISILTAPTVSSPEFLSLVRLEMLEYRACDLPTVTFTTVLQKQSPRLREQNRTPIAQTILFYYVPEHEICLSIFQHIQVFHLMHLPGLGK